MAAGLVLAGATDADGSARGDLSEELDRLAAGGVGEQLALVSVEGFLKRGGRAVDFFLDFGDKFGAGRERAARRRSSRRLPSGLWALPEAESA